MILFLIIILEKSKIEFPHTNQFTSVLFRSDLSIKIFKYIKIFSAHNTTIIAETTRLIFIFFFLHIFWVINIFYCTFKSYIFHCVYFFAFILYLFDNQLKKKQNMSRGIAMDLLWRTIPLTVAADMYNRCVRNFSLILPLFVFNFFFLLFIKIFFCYTNVLLNIFVIFFRTKWNIVYIFCNFTHAFFFFEKFYPHSINMELLFLSVLCVLSP